MDNLLIALGLAIGILALWLSALATRLTATQIALDLETKRANRLDQFLTENKMALQRALGGGWTLADPKKDIFLLPEAMVTDWFDNSAGGGRQQERRAATVTILAVGEQWKRLAMVIGRQGPIAFRGLEWTLANVRRKSDYISSNNREPVMDVPELDLELVAYASR